MVPGQLFPGGKGPLDHKDRPNILLAIRQRPSHGSEALGRLGKQWNGGQILLKKDSGKAKKQNPAKRQRGFGFLHALRYTWKKGGRGE